MVLSQDGLLLSEWSFLKLPGVSVCLVLLLFFLLRRAALPKPIPGIPYNVASATRFFGDVPEWSKEKRGLRFWMRDQFIIHNSPIVQIFVAPFKKPWVLISDFRESQDMIMRRTAEFDRSGLTKESFGSLVPHSYICMKTYDTRFRRNKELVKDLMTTGFLHDVSAPEIYEKTAAILDLWTVKTRMANSMPFRADQDIHLFALDIIMAVTFDFPLSSTITIMQLNQLREQGIEQTSAESPRDSFCFPEIELDPELEACTYLTESVGVGFQSPLLALAHWWYLQSKKSQRMIRLRDELIRRNIDKSVERLYSRGLDKKQRCAVDQILIQEAAIAEKRGLKPNFHKSIIYDELFIYILAGHDTTSITLTWWIKFINVRDKRAGRTSELATYT